MNILVVDIGGTSAKVWKTGESDKVKIPTGKEYMPAKLVKELRQVVGHWSFERVSIGYPGHIHNGHPVAEPYNLGSGWVEFDYAKAFGCPVRVMNDACMQALGSYDGGQMLYLGFGTSIGTAFIADGKIVPLALGHLRFTREGTFDEALSRSALEQRGVKRWRSDVVQAATILRDAFLAEYVVLGGGNAKKLKDLPEGCRRGGNHNAYFGGLRMWDDARHVDGPALAVHHENWTSAV